MVRQAETGTWATVRTATWRAFGLAGRHVLWIALFTLPAIVLWWHVWTGHPSSTLTCPCGDPAQEVWFMAWPAWAIAHLGNIFFSGVVNVPAGANLLSNTSGSLVGTVLSPVTWLWGPVVATNVALTLAPGLSAWGCWRALREFVSWKPGTIPAALVYGYSSAIVSSLAFGHVSVSVLFVPPLLVASLHRIVVRQDRSPLRDGLVLAGLMITQFFISPEVLVMCALLSVVGLVVTAVVGWRSVANRLLYAVPALAVGTGVTVAVVAYPAWFGLDGPQAVSGVLFATAPLSGVLISGYLSPGRYGAFSDTYVRFGGYVGRIGPPTNYVGWGTAASAAFALFFARRRPLVWVLVILTLVTMWLSLGSYLLGGSLVLWRGWMPWRTLGRLPVLREILPDQLAPLVPLFISFVLALGLDAVYEYVKATSKKHALRIEVLTGLATMAVGLATLLPVFLTFDMPFTVRSTAIPAWVLHDAPALPANTVLLTVPFAVSGSAQPMLWQAVDDMHFRLAGAALKTPDAGGGPVAQGTPGSARRILTDLTVGTGDSEPAGTAAQQATVRRALRAWHVNEVVVDGSSRDPAYASGFFTAVFGTAPSYTRRAWVWKVPPGGPVTPLVAGTTLSHCQSSAAGSAGNSRRHPLGMAECVLRAGASQ